ncbi:MAG: DUF362 domain-containing protein [bacterium]
MERREFVKTGLKGSAVIAMGSVPCIGAGEKKSTVFIAKGSPAEAVTKAVSALGGLGKFIKKDNRVLVKANIGFANPPEFSTTTHPEVVKTVVELCLEAGARRVIVFDHPLGNPELCKKRSGIQDAVKDIKKCVLFMPDKPEKYEKVIVDGASVLKSTEIGIEVLKADCIINLPTGKHHSLTGVSLGFKNLMGLIWDRKVFHQELDIDRAIAELGLVIKPQITIIEMIHALLTRGPQGPGKVQKNINKIIASTDMLAADAVAVKQALWDNRKVEPLSIKHLKEAARLRLGKIKDEDIIVKEV